MKKIEVLYLIDYPLDLPGGAQTSTLQLSNGINKIEDISMISGPKLIKKGSYSNVIYNQYSISNNGLIYKVLLLFEIFRVVKKTQPRVVHSQMPLNALAFGFLKNLGFFQDVHFVFTDRGLLKGYKETTRRLLKWCLSKADLLICTTEMNARAWHTYLLSSIKVHTIPNSVSSYFYREIDSLHDNDFIMKEVFTVGFAGRITELKNWPLAVVICESLVKRGLYFRVKLAVSAYTNNEKCELNRIVESLISILGPDNVDVLIDLSNSKMPNFYSECHCFVITSTFESFGRTAIECMAAGNALIASSVGGLKEVIGSPDYMYYLNDVNKCIKFIEDRYFNRKLIENDRLFLRGRYSSNYTEEANIAKHFLAYEQLLSRVN